MSVQECTQGRSIASRTGQEPGGGGNLAACTMEQVGGLHTCCSKSTQRTKLVLAVWTSAQERLRRATGKHLEVRGGPHD